MITLHWFKLTGSDQSDNTDTLHWFKLTGSDQSGNTDTLHWFKLTGSDQSGNTDICKVWTCTPTFRQTYMLNIYQHIHLLITCLFALGFFLLHFMFNIYQHIHFLITCLFALFVFLLHFNLIIISTRPQGTKRMSASHVRTRAYTHSICRCGCR